MDNRNSIKIIFKKEIIIPLLCSIIFFILGSWYTKWVAVDTHNEYLKQILNNAISEVEYDLNISWYNDEKYIETTNIYCFLKDDALWQVYYNSNQLFQNNPAAIDKIRECLNDIDAINRKVRQQYSLVGFGFNTKSYSDKELERNIIIAIENAEANRIINLHKDMNSLYNKTTKSLLSQIKKYLEKKHNLM